MQPTEAHATHAIFDDWLPARDLALVWDYFQAESMERVPLAAAAWRLEDGAPLHGPAYAVARDADGRAVHDADAGYPTGTPLDFITERLIDAAPALRPWIGQDWRLLTGHAFAYPRGSALSWHADDRQQYSGAFTFYAHPTWNVQWGGELMVADVDRDAELPALGGRRFDNREYSAALMERGGGRFVMAKPNRLVVLGGAPHMVARVSDAAGHNVRASVSGFFVR